MEKDKSITDLISKLQGATNFNLVEIADHWDGDLCAIGFKKDRRLVYVSTFNGADNYYYELELLDETQIDNITVLQSGDNVPEHVFIDIVRQFLGI